MRRTGLISFAVAGPVDGRGQPYAVAAGSRSVNARASVASVFLLLCVIWGSTWLAIKLGVEAVPTFLSAMLRFAVAAAVLLALAAGFHRKLPRTRPEWGVVLFVGVAMFVGDYGLIYWAEANGVASGLTAVLFATMPLMTALAAHGLLPQERLTARKLLGIAFGFGGVAVIFRGQVATAGLGQLYPMLAVVVASACAGTGTAAMRKWARSIDGFAFNGLAMAIGAAGLAAVSLGTGERWSVPSWPNGFAPILYLGLVGSVVAFVLYLRLLRQAEATSASFIMVITPIVALLLGVSFASETLDAVDALGTAVTLAGIYISFSKRRPASMADARTQRAESPDVVELDPSDRK